MVIISIVFFTTFTVVLIAIFGMALLGIKKSLSRICSTEKAPWQVVAYGLICALLVLALVVPTYSYTKNTLKTGLGLAFDNPVVVVEGSVVTSSNHNSHKIRRLVRRLETSEGEYRVPFFLKSVEVDHSYQISVIRGTQYIVNIK